MSIDYSRDCQNEFDRREEIAAAREQQIEDSAEAMLENEMDQVLLDLPHYLDEHEFKKISKLYRTDKAELGEFIADALKKTAISIQELE